MSKQLEIRNAKNQLAEVLGEDMKKYLHFLKCWFKMKLTKEEFDIQARSLLKPEHISLHNSFLLAVFSLVSVNDAAPSRPTNNVTISSPVGDKKFTSRKNTQAQQPFKPIDPVEYMVDAGGRPSTEDTAVSYCSHEASLPDSGMLTGRLLVIAWETGLEGVQDVTVNYILHALANFLKNILQAVIRRRKSYKVRNGGFIHGFGSGEADPWLRGQCHRDHKVRDMYDSDIPLTLDEAEQQAAFTLASTTPQPQLKPLNLTDVYEALQVHKGVVQSQMIYALNMERIASKLWHPSNEEIEQDHIHKTKRQKLFSGVT